MSPPPSDLTIRQAADALRDGSLTCLALTESVLQRIAATEPKLNAYITVTADAAREEAAAADVELRAGRDRGPLHGIPFALKDLIDTAGVRTTAGSALFRDRVPHEDAFVTGKLKRAGIVLTGKLGLHEFAFGTTSTNPHFGSIRNPWNLDHVPGGSSGGAAAAIAVGSALGALGSDSGGSIRIPASLCGVVGLMATYGRVSRSGVLPLSWSLDHVGPLAKTVEDAALILNAIAGPDPADPSSADEPVDDYTSALGRDLRGLRIGLLRDPLWHDCDDEVVTACETAVDVLREQGAIVSEVELPLLARVRSARTLDILTAEAAAYHAEWLRAQPQQYSEEVRRKLGLGAPVLATDYINQQRFRRQLIDETRQALRRVDALVSPTTATTAPTIEDGDPHAELARLTAPYDFTGIPAISVPCGIDANGLPIGLMIGARHFDEVTLCRIAHAYEQATPWHTKRPPL